MKQTLPKPPEYIKIELERLIAQAQSQTDMGERQNIITALMTNLGHICTKYDITDYFERYETLRDEMVKIHARYWEERFGGGVS